MKHSDISYLPSGRAEKLDLYQPDSIRFPGLRPVIIMIHGGGWAAGDKATPREIDIATTLASHGYATVSINYRLSQYESAILKSPILHQAWPENFYDCRAAVRFVENQGEAYAIDPTRMALLGTSAGAHLALLTAFRPMPTESPLPRLSAIVSMYGVHDLRFVDAKYFPKESIEEASPVTYFSRGGPPVCIVHGDCDTTVPIAVAEDMAEKFTAHGVPYEFVRVPGADHSFDLHPPQMDIETPVLDFLNRHLGK